jgi:hypothetical protein
MSAGFSVEPELTVGLFSYFYHGVGIFSQFRAVYFRVSRHQAHELNLCFGKVPEDKRWLSL